MILVTGVQSPYRAQQKSLWDFLQVIMHQLPDYELLMSDNDKNLSCFSLISRTTCNLQDITFMQKNIYD